LIGNIDDDFYEKLDEALDAKDVKWKWNVKLNLASKFSEEACEKIFKSKDFSKINAKPIQSNKKKGGKKKKNSDDDEEEKGGNFMVEVIDFENTDEGELLNKIVKEVVEEYLKRKKIVFYVGEIEDVS